MDIEMSLDDIIQKKKTVNTPTYPRGRGGIRRGVTRSQTAEKVNPIFKNGSILSRRGGLVRGTSLRGKPNDARLTIIQKNRAKLTDARDKLAQIAKQTDARFKLQKLRGVLHPRDAIESTYSRNIGAITLNTSRNGQMSLTTNSNRGMGPSRGILKRTSSGRMIPFADRLTQSIAEAAFDVDISRHDSYIPQEPRTIQRSIKNDLISPDYVPTAAYKRPQLKRTVTNDIHGMPPLPDIRPRWEELRSMRSPPSHSLRLSSPRRSLRDTNIKVMVKRSGAGTTRRTFDDSPPHPRRRLTRGGDHFGDVHSRLDTRPAPIRTMGILSRTPTPPNPPPGTRIVVSNLQPNVTQEDIKELFEDVGELLESRLVRPGTAEVIFKSLKDAQQAVEVYHNRQLDGQPMKCLLVNPRANNKPTAPALRSSLPASRPVGPAVRKVPSTTKSVVEPDIDTFHSVMFKRRA